MSLANASSEKQQQERDVTAHQDYFEEGAPAPAIEELLSKLQPLCARIYQLLQPAGPHRIGVVTGDDDAGRRCLAFTETELRIIVAFLTTTTLSLDDLETKALRRQYVSLLSAIPHFAEEVLGEFEVDPSRLTLLGRASQFFRRRKSYYWHSAFLPLKLYYISDALCSYRSRPLLPPTRSLRLGLTPQLAEVGALPPIGIDRRAKKIFWWLARQGKKDMSQLRVMSIVGPVGIGKTTLAVELRNRLIRHETSSGGRYNFQCNVMAQASRVADRNIGLLRDILSQVSEPAAMIARSTDDPSQDKTVELLVHLVSENLRDKRYFVIIDDIWEAKDWKKIKGPFPKNNLDSRILVTTRSTGIARACCSGSYYGHVHEMKPLSQMDSERLLLAKAVGSADGCLPNHLKLICDEILWRCDGIPLFITTMADWLKEQRLHKQHQREEEDDDEKHQRFAMHFEEQVPQLPERLEQALSSGFSDFLNDESRSLLLYMSMFPYGYKFDMDSLILKWMHEVAIYSSIICNEALRVKKAAERFFYRLVDRNVITCAASNWKYNQDEAEVCQWQLNHFIQQFLVSKSGEMGFLFTTSTLNLLAAASPPTGHGNEPSSSRMPRRLALHHPDPQLPLLLETIDLSQTRSLAVSGDVNSGTIPVHRFANLVVLDLQGWKNFTDEDLLKGCRSKMFFLRYLSIRNTRVNKLPREIKELRSLRALDISHTQISELPLELFQLEYLGHLDLRGTRISQLPKQTKHRKIQLLIGGEGTINFLETRIGLSDFSPVPLLKQLLTLATSDLTEQPASINALSDLYWWRHIAITWSFHQSTDKDSRDALVSFIGNCGNWDFDNMSLTIHCGLGCSMEFLGSLEKSCVPKKLKKFKVTAGRFASVPAWINGLKLLAFVQITICNKETTMDDLQILGSLPRLESLILGLDFIPFQAIVIENQSFRKLQRFSLDCVLPWLTFKKHAMPRLSHLQLKFSSGPASEECVPSGITNLSRISQVVLSYSKWCANSTSVKMTVKAVKEEVAKHHNLIDLFINGIEKYGVQIVDEVAENATGTSSSSRTDALPVRDDAQAVDEEATGVAQTEITEAES